MREGGRKGKAMERGERGRRGEEGRGKRRASAGYKT